MKSIKSDGPCEHETTYPCLMEGSRKSVVLLTKESYGTMVHVGNSSNYLGQTGSWPMSNFKPYNDSVCLKN